ncbi:MAG: beta-glucosidase [Rhodobacterales bacterium]|nr:MAG: beta-glucosidase [Rhodobacterales bacterium]
MPLTTTRADFPDGFLFGAATAATQIEGSSFGGAGPSHWDTFAATPGNTDKGDNPAVACGSYTRLDEDLDLLEGAHLDAYRFSLNWSRVLPEGRGAANPEGLDYYERLVDGALERGLKPMATLYHWDMPAALADLGGWRNRDVAEWFADYAEVVIRRLGDRLFSTATINEPWCVSYLSHFLGVHAPGLRDIRATARAMHFVLLAHGKGIGRMRALGQKNLGIVLNHEDITPADDSPEAAAAAAREDATYNRWFLEGVFRGSYPAEALEGLGPHMPRGWQDDMATISAPLDWIGSNYYTRSLIAPADGPWPATTHVAGPLPKTEMGWEIFPEGLTNVLERVRAHAGGIPQYMSENGMAAPDVVANGEVADADRIAYIDAHFRAALKAIEAGVPLKGFIIWTLIDNFEWAVGYDKRFGIVRVDFDTLERTPKASYHALKAALARD